MGGILITFCILLIAGYAYLMGRRDGDELRKEIRDDEAIARLHQPPARTPPPIKKPRLKVCGGCGKLCRSQYQQLINCKPSFMCNH